MGNRRSIYGLVDRQFLPGVYRVFDFASPDLHIPQRSATTVPQQALFFMNGPFVAARAKALAGRMGPGEGESEADRVRRLYRAVYQRPPTDAQVDAALEFVRAAAEPPKTPPAKVVSATADAWQYGYGEFDAASDRLKTFTPLPHFNGQAWQGGPSWPDATLGWVQLHATGGHAGNDPAHDAVRRWVAPRDMAVRIDGTLRHEHVGGNGVAARIVSSRAGTLGQWAVHNSAAEAKVERLDLKQGDTIDFVIDLNGDLSYDMFLWAPVVTALDAAPGGGAPMAWNATADFPAGPPMATGPVDPWAMLAHALLLSNEFVFVD
jgi:hypothetical protein